MKNLKIKVSIDTKNILLLPPKLELTAKYKTDEIIRTKQSKKPERNMSLAIFTIARGKTFVVQLNYEQNNHLEQFDLT